MNLKNLRKEKKFSQKEVAEKLNVAPTTYLGYEKETSEPAIETLCKLADFYGVSLDYLVGREFSSDIGYLSNEQKNIVYVIKQLNAENLDKILSNALKLLNEQKK